MCLIKYLVNRRSKAIYPNWNCKAREIETFISLAVLQDKSTTADENSISKPVDSGNQTPVDDDVILMNELGLLGGEEQSDHEVTSSSKTTDKVSSSIERCSLKRT